MLPGGRKRPPLPARRLTTRRFDVCGSCAGQGVWGDLRFLVGDRSSCKNRGLHGPQVGGDRGKRRVFGLEIGGECFALGDDVPSCCRGSGRWSARAGRGRCRCLRGYERRAVDGSHGYRGTSLCVRRAAVWHAESLKCRRAVSSWPAQNLVECCRNARTTRTARSGRYPGDSRRQRPNRPAGRPGTARGCGPHRPPATGLGLPVRRAQRYLGVRRVLRTDGPG